MSIKHIITAICICCMVSPVLSAQKKGKKEAAQPEGYIFETVKENPITSVKNQSSSSTCWCFSAISFFESEILRNGYTLPLDLSEMYIVHKSYQEKAEKYVRLHGSLNFAPGSSFGNVLYGLKNYGAVPESEMPGLNYGTDIHRHGELDRLLRAYVDVIIKNPNRQLSTAWQAGLKGILDAYLGECPETFTVDGKEYNPHTYVESLGINLDDYIDVTSWTHKPFYQKMIIEVPDNWLWESSMNVPIDDLVAIIDNAVNNGYTVAWAADVSERGFNRDGLGIVPDYEALEAEIKEVGSDQAHWIGSDNSNPQAIAFLEPCPELEITQEMRQIGYDTYQTTDDHGMHIFGIAKDQNGKKYYMVKNSWGDAGKYHGIWYVSEAYVRYKTMDIMVNKNAIPADIRAKMGL